MFAADPQAANAKLRPCTRPLGLALALAHRETLSVATQQQVVLRLPHPISGVKRRHAQRLNSSRTTLFSNFCL